MARIIVFLAAALLLYLLWQQLKKCNPKERRSLLLKAGFWALLGLSVLLVATGRVHWIAAALTAAIPVIKGLFAIALRSLPFLQVWLKNRQQQSSQTPSQPPQQQMTEEEALQLLGLEPGASEEDIIQAHKKLIQKLHPDRGGNDYLAAKLNAARDLLLAK